MARFSVAGLVVDDRKWHGGRSIRWWGGSNDFCRSWGKGVTVGSAAGLVQAISSSVVKKMTMRAAFVFILDLMNEIWRLIVIKSVSLYVVISQ